MDCENCTLASTQQSPLNLATHEDQNCWIVFLVSFMFLVGLFKLLRLFYRILSPHSWLPNDLQKRYVPQGGKSWALITGGSQGIGLGFAEELAKLNFNIILMSRSQNKLKLAQDQILKTYPNIQVKYFPFDFSNLHTAEDYQKLLQQLNEFDISVLVNNVGLLNCTKFLDSTYDQIRNQTVVNLLPITCLTRLFLPKMIQRNKKMNKRSAIINLSSSSALTPLECSSNYCSTKIYDDMFTQTVAIEYRNEPVDFLTVRPFLVTSRMTRGQRTLLHVTANHCAEGALRDLGRKVVSYGHWWHRVQGALAQELSSKMINLIMCQVNRGLSQTYKEIDNKQK